MPQIAIIIATYNSATTLKRCLDSCFELTGISYNVYVADGGSTDQTVEICKQYPLLNLMCSEPDNGIYDAWNKVLTQIEANWYCFIGSDDYFSSKDSLSYILDKAEPRSNYISGNAVLFKPNTENRFNRFIGRPYTSSDFRKKMPAIHSGSLHHKTIIKPNNFDSSFAIAGDYDLLCRNLHHLKPQYVPKIVIHMQDGGVSKRRLLSVIKETYKIRKIYFGIAGYAFIIMLAKAYFSKVKSIWH